jgi:hypothetical protein
VSLYPTQKYNFKASWIWRAGNVEVKTPNPELFDVSVPAYGTSNRGFSNEVIQPNPDALTEFKVETDNYSAEFGRMPGAVINDYRGP